MFHFVSVLLLPAATKLWPRLCFYTCVWFCSHTGRETPQAGRTHPGGENPPPWEQTPPQSRHPPGRETLLGRENPPPRSRHSLWEQTPPQAGRTPREQTPPPPGADTPPGSRLQHTVNERPVRILLECILVYLVYIFLSCYHFQYLLQFYLNSKLYH